VGTSSGQDSFQRRATALARTRSLSEYVSTQAVNTEDVEHVVRGIKHELELLLRERAAIVKRIGVIKQTIAGLADVFGIDMADEELWGVLSEQSSHRRSRPHPGLTDACRRALMALCQPVTTHLLCDRMQETNPSILLHHKRPTTSVTVVLRRLVSYGEVQDGFNEKNVRTWLWIGPRQGKEPFEDSPPASLKHGQPSHETEPVETTG